SVERLVDELATQLDAAPAVLLPPGRAVGHHADAFRVLFREGGDARRIAELTTKLERFAAHYGTRVVWPSACPVEGNQAWVGIYEYERIRICPLSAADALAVGLHECGHLLQDRVFHHEFDQTEADAISWVVQRRLGLPVTFVTTAHMRGTYGSRGEQI